MKSDADYEAIKSKLNTQQIEREQTIRRKLETCSLDELLTKTSEIQEKANAQILEYGRMQKKSFPSLPELVHDTSLSIEAQKTQLIDQYIVGMNRLAQVDSAIKVKINRDEAMNKYQAMKLQARTQRSPQASSSTAASACEDTELKKSGPGPI